MPICVYCLWNEKEASDSSEKSNDKDLLPH